MKHYIYFYFSPNILLQCTNSVYCLRFEGNTKKHFAEVAGRMFVCRQFNTGWKQTVTVYMQLHQHPGSNIKQ